jgi:hypothetical protein
MVAPLEREAQDVRPPVIDLRAVDDVFFHASAQNRGLAFRSALLLQALGPRRGSDERRAFSTDLEVDRRKNLISLAFPKWRVQPDGRHNRLEKRPTATSESGFNRVGSGDENSGS